MQTTELFEMKKLLEHKKGLALVVDNFFEDTLNVLINQLKQAEDNVRDCRKNVVDEREGLGEMDKYGIDLDDALMGEVEEAQALIKWFAKFVNHECYGKFESLSYTLDKDIENIEQAIEEYEKQLVQQYK